MRIAAETQIVRLPVKTRSVSAEVASRLAELLDGRLALLHQALGLLGDALVGAGEAYGACEDAATTALDGAP